MDTLTLKHLPGRKQSNTTPVGIKIHSVFIIFFVLIASVLPGLAQKGSTSLSLKYGMSYSNIRFSPGGSYSALFSKTSSPTLSMQIKHQISTTFRLGIETGFFNENRDVNWKSTPVNGIYKDLTGTYQRNTLTALITPEYSIPGADWLYLGAGIGFAHHFNRNVANALIEDHGPLMYKSESNQAFSIEDDLGLIWKLGAGFQVPIAKTFLVGMDLSYYRSTRAGGRLGYLSSFNLMPAIGYSGFVVSMSIGLNIPGT